VSDQPFTFDTCDSPATCREGLTRLLAVGQDWSEIHCGRCGKQGIVRHADPLVAARAAQNPALSGNPAPAPTGLAALPASVEATDEHQAEPAAGDAE
jgi:hypothetical protein